MDPHVRSLVERAFDYRGYVTIVRNDGSQLVGYLYDRSDAHVDLFDERAEQRTRVPAEQIADVRFSGEDAAAKSQEIWERRKGALEPLDTPAHGGWTQTLPALFVVAMEQELRAVAEAMGGRARAGVARGHLHGREVAAVAIGMGGDPRRAIEADRPACVVSCGFGGALSPDLRAGDLVLASAVQAPDGEVLPAPDLQVTRALPRAIRGQLVCAPQVAVTPEEKRRLAKGGAIAVDLESAQVARAAARAGVPWLALRAIVDEADVTLPPFAREARSDYVLPALRHALRGPGAALQLLRLARAARAATASLTAAVQSIGAALP
jgi:adenosylhomocysteine nucleosidase